MSANESQVPAKVQQYLTQNFQNVTVDHGGGYIFGHLSALQDGGDVDVFPTHALLGDDLDEPELSRAVGGLLSSADKMVDGLKGQFGVRRFHDDYVG